MLRAASGDFRHAVRQLSRHRIYTLTTIVILALGLGVNAAAFAVSWHFLFKPLPWPNGDRLVQIWNTSKRNGAATCSRRRTIWTSRARRAPSSGWQRTRISTLR